MKICTYYFSSYNLKLIYLISVVITYCSLQKKRPLLNSKRQIRSTCHMSPGDLSLSYHRHENTEHRKSFFLCLCVEEKDIELMILGYFDTSPNSWITETIESFQINRAIYTLLFICPFLNLCLH